MGDVISRIWELPWYQVLVIAAADDVILLLKLWWVFLIIIIFSGVFLWMIE